MASLLWVNKGWLSTKVGWAHGRINTTTVAGHKVVYSQHYLIMVLSALRTMFKKIFNTSFYEK